MMKLELNLSKRKKIVFAACGGVAILLIVSLAVKGARGMEVETAAVSKGDVEDIYTEEGTISFGRDYQVMTQVSGPVSEICVEENSEVKKGDILFTIDDKDLRYEKELDESARDGCKAQLEQSRIDQLMTSSPQEYLDSVKREMDARQADYQAAKTVYDGMAALYGQGLVSTVEWEEKEAAFKEAQSAWQQAEGRYAQSQEFLGRLREGGIDESTINARFYESIEGQLTSQLASQETAISQLEDKIKDCVVRADRDGIVISLPVQDMSVIQEGDTAAVISGKGKMQVESDVLTSIVPYLHIGDPVSVVLKLKDRDQAFAGTISQIHDYAVKGTSALGLDEYRVRVTADLEGDQLLEGKEGYGADVRFLLYQGTDELVIPSNCVFKEDDRDYVYMIRGGRAVKVPVDLSYKTASQAVIAGGLEEGQKVINQVDAEGIYEGARLHD